MSRPEAGCQLQIDGITIAHQVLNGALIDEMEANHVIMQLSNPVTLEVGVASGKQLRRFVPGDIHVIPQGSSISLYAMSTGHAIVMTFNNQVLERSLDKKEDLTGRESSLVLHLGVRDLQLQCLLSAVEAELRSGCHTGPGYLRPLGAALTSYLTRRYSTAATTGAPLSDGLPLHRLRTVLDHIHTHLEDSLTVTRLAEMVRMSPQHFANLFRRSTGLAPHRYVLGRRIERAEHLLCTTDLSLAEVTLESGFANQSHFTDVFRKFVGTTPRQYRTRFTPDPPVPQEGRGGIWGACPSRSIPPESNLKKPSGSLGNSTEAGPEQLSMCFDVDNVKCG
jgi:AraC family transcriptional regulator